jgi:hypothetical protein
MLVQRQHQNDSRAMAQGTADCHPNGAPAYYLRRPARLWISVTRPHRMRSTPGHLAGITR